MRGTRRSGLVRRLVVAAAGGLLAAGALGAVPAGAATPRVVRPVQGPDAAQRVDTSTGAMRDGAAARTVRSTTFAYNWAGEVEPTTSTAPFVSVSGSWVVPSVSGPGTTFSATWVGIDGWSNADLIQTGTTQYVSHGGSGSYYAWWEILPASSTVIPETVSAGDHMSATIAKTAASGKWKISLSDLTKGWTWQTSFSYTGPGTSAEWIEEAPTVTSQRAPLADFTTATFSAMKANGATPPANRLRAVVMLDNATTKKVTAYPGAYATGGFPVSYGSPTARITSIHLDGDPLTPPSGSETTIFGTYLWAEGNTSLVRSVDFGTTAATISSVATGEVVVDTPSRSTPGPVALTVTTTDGTSSTGATVTYFAPPTATSLSPSSGPTTGGGTVTIAGQNLPSSKTVGTTAAVSVEIGGQPAPVDSVSSTQVTVTAPAHAAGTVAVTVTTPGGTSGALTYTYVAVPVVASVSPSAGPLSGGVSVVISGENLSTASAVDFGATPAVVVSDASTQVTVTAPAHAAGTVSVTVTTPKGTSTASNAAKFTYDAVPTISSLTPTSGTTTGGTSVVISGTNLSTASGVDFGATPAVVVSDASTQVKATAPAHAAGTVPVTVTTPGGTSGGVSFSYVAPPAPAPSGGGGGGGGGAPAIASPVVSSIRPSSGPIGGGTHVELVGTNLSTASAVDFGATPAVVVSDASTQVAVVAPAHATGTVPVTVTTPGGTSGGVSFSYVAPHASRVFGQTADATAAAELAHQFTPSSGGCPASRAVVLTRDDYYSDALSGAYLAGLLGTGTLVTPTTRLSAPAEAAIEDEGISHVYVIGGDLAVSPAVVQTIESLPVHSCGGAGTSGGSVQVTRVAGPTQDATAAGVATLEGASSVGAAAFPGAYVGVNGLGGRGSFNATAGSASAASPSGAVATAVVATSVTYQDAESAGVMAYAEHFPILLAAPASLPSASVAAIEQLGIRQAIVMGGPDAIGDVVVRQLERLGVSVLRIAGADYTQTAVEAADFCLSASGLDWTPTTGVVVARGNFYSDGLAGAVVGAGAGPSAPHGPEPLLLTEDPTTPGPYLAAFLSGAGATGIDGDGRPIDSLTVLGGALAVAPGAVSAMQSDLTAGTTG